MVNSHIELTVLPDRASGKYSQILLIIPRLALPVTMGIAVIQSLIRITLLIMGEGAGFRTGATRDFEPCDLVSS